MDAPAWRGEKMKKLFVGILMVCLMVGVGGVASATDCSSAITAWKASGNLVVNIDGDSAMAYVEILQWRSMTYNQKYSLAECIKRVHGVSDVYVFPLGASTASDMLASHRSGKKFRVYK